MKKNTFLKKQQPPEPIHLMTEVTSILGSICKLKIVHIIFQSVKFINYWLRIFAPKNNTINNIWR